MSPVSAHRPFRAVMWGAIGVSLVAVLMAGVLRLDTRLAGYVVGALILVCLAVCVAASGIDARSDRARRRLLDQLNDRPKRRKEPR